MSSQPAQHDQLPETLPIFPLRALLFPRGSLPLVIFEPRYLNMLDDAMVSHEMIGMIQPLGGERGRPIVANIGCAGYIETYDETEDGRYHISLRGICRFKTAVELDVQTPYRQVLADYSSFHDDFKAPDTSDLPDRLRIEAALQIYMDRTAGGIAPQATAFRDTPYETLVNVVSMSCQFRPIDQQALLEAKSLKERTEILIKLLSTFGGTDRTTGYTQ